MMAELDPAVEQQLADMSDQDWRSLSARVRPPTSSQQLREMAGKVLDADQLETFMAVANPKAFAGENGDVDEATLTGHLTRLFGAGESQQQGTQANWGQHSATGGPGKQLGDDGRAALAKRHGVKTAPPLPIDGTGDIARGALTKRYGVGRQRS
jgi:hypothetical protein